MNPKCIYWKQKDKDEYNLSDEILGQELDDDFFFFFIFGRHANYLANPNRIIIRFKRNVNNNNISFGIIEIYAILLEDVFDINN